MIRVAGSPAKLEDGEWGVRLSGDRYLSEIDGIATLKFVASRGQLETGITTRTGRFWVAQVKEIVAGGYERKSSRWWAIGRTA